jgi:hypothetical protein
MPPVPETERGPVPVRLAPRFTALQAQVGVFQRGPDKASVAQAEQILQGSRLSEETYEALETVLLVLVHADRLDRARFWSDALLAEAVERRSLGWEAVFAATRAMVAVRCGDLATALERAELALSHATPESWGLAVGVPLSALLLACTEAGEYEQAERVLRQAVPDAMFDSRHGMDYTARTASATPWRPGTCGRTPCGTRPARAPSRHTWTSASSAPDPRLLPTRARGCRRGPDGEYLLFECFSQL